MPSDHIPVSLRVEEFYPFRRLLHLVFPSCEDSQRGSSLPQVAQGKMSDQPRLQGSLLASEFSDLHYPHPLSP